MLSRKQAVRLVRNGRRVCGGVYRLSDGRAVYLAYRKLSEMHCGGETSLSEAVANGKASWAIDNDALIRLRVDGVYLVGILVEATGDIYLSTLGEFLKAPVKTHTARGGALHRYLPLDRFMIRLGSMKGVKAPTRRAR